MTGRVARPSSRNANEKKALAKSQGHFGSTMSAPELAAAVQARTLFLDKRFRANRRLLGGNHSEAAWAR